MNETLQFVVRHGSLLVFAWVLIEQAGLPIPSAPLLLAVGALSGMGRMNLAVAAAIAIAAALLGDSLWYEIGRGKGASVLQWVCRISLEPDSCVRRTQERFSKSGARVLLISKFIPGLNAMAAPLAGITRVSRQRFALYDLAGTAIWVAAYTGVGFAFSSQFEAIVREASYFGEWLVVVLLAGFGGYALWKYFNRRKFLNSLRIARITPDELKEKLDAGEDVIIVDVRHTIEFDAQPETIPGALHMDAAALEEASEVIPRDREIVLFCSCPNEATAARLALLLRNQGITRIRPLAEGYEGWRSRGFPLMIQPDKQSAEAASTGAVPLGT